RARGDDAERIVEIALLGSFLEIGVDCWRYGWTHAAPPLPHPVELGAHTSSPGRERERNPAGPKSVVRSLNQALGGIGYCASRQSFRRMPTASRWTRSSWRAFNASA